VQAKFPANKVFATRFGCQDGEPERIDYTNVARNWGFVAIFAGTGKSEAEDFLETVRKEGTFRARACGRCRRYSSIRESARPRPRKLRKPVAEAHPADVVLEPRVMRRRKGGRGILAAGREVDGRRIVALVGERRCRTSRRRFG
jgi:hypothetical protein